MYYTKLVIHGRLAYRRDMPKTNLMTLRVEDDLRARLEQVRGARSMSETVRQLLLKALADQEPAPTKERNSELESLLR